MKKKVSALKKAGLFIAIIAIMGIAGCSLFPQIVKLGDLGAILAVDADGQFKEDIVYTMYNGQQVYSFMKDGSYNYSYYSHEGSTEDIDGDGVSNEGWVQNSGTKGTYSYNAKTMILAYTFTHSYSADTNGKKMWIPLTNDSSAISWEENAYFTTSQFGSSCVKVDGTDNQWKVYSKSIKKDGGNSYSETIYTIDSANNSFISTWSNITVDASNNITQSNANTGKKTYAITAMFPENVKWKNGNTVTFSLEMTAYQYAPLEWPAYTYGSVTNIATADINDYTSGKTAKTMINAKDFIIYYIDVTSTRSETDDPEALR